MYSIWYLYATHSIPLAQRFFTTLRHGLYNLDKSHALQSKKVKHFFEHMSFSNRGIGCTSGLGYRVFADNFHIQDERLLQHSALICRHNAPSELKRDMTIKHLKVLMISAGCRSKISLKSVGGVQFRGVTKRKIVPPTRGLNTKH